MFLYLLLLSSFTSTILTVEATCNILSSSSACLLPFPDDFWRIPSNGNIKAHVNLDNTSLPIDGQGGQIDPNSGGYNSLSGFSTLGPILASIPGVDLTASSLPRLWDISSSSNVLTSSSILYDAVSKTVLEHWVELDESSDGPTPYEKALLAWPASRLFDSTRHIVAFRNLVDVNGIPITRSDGFDALVRNIPTNNPAIEAARPRFNSIFTELEALGWPRENLTLAWDFTTMSTDDVTSVFISMRDDALQRIANGVRFEITSIDNTPAANTSRRIHGQFYVPCYLNYNAIPALDSHLILDVQGKPVYQNDVAFDFEVVVPLSVAANGVPVPVLQYGHGLFGDHGEVEESYLASFAQANGYVLAATDWIGLSEYDEATVIVMMAGGDGGFTDFKIVPDRLHQGMLNAIILMRLVTSEAFVKDASVLFNGKQVISTALVDRFYTGNSQGGIMGGVYMASSPDVIRGVLGVGGGPYALLLPRSSDFSELFDILKIRYPRSIDRMIILALMQMLWDKMDPAGWANYIANPVDGSKARRIIMHYGLGDHQVTWLGAHAIAKSVNAKMFVSNVREGNESLAYFDTVSDSTILTDGSAILGFDFGFPINPFINIPPSSGPDAHECPRRAPQAQAQMARFFATGDIVNTCQGPCVLNGCPSG